MDKQPTLTHFIHEQFQKPDHMLHVSILADGVVVDELTERTGTTEARERFLVDLLVHAGLVGMEALQIDCHPADDPWDTVAAWKGAV